MTDKFFKESFRSLNSVKVPTISVMDVVEERVFARSNLIFLETVTGFAILLLLCVGVYSIFGVDNSQNEDVITAFQIIPATDTERLAFISTAVDKEDLLGYLVQF